MDHVAHMPARALEADTPTPKRLHPFELFVTLFVNWLVKPFSMALIAWLFFRYVCSPWIGVLVEQFDPATAQHEVDKRPAVQQALADEGERSLPVILVNESVVSRGRYLSRAQARPRGRARTGLRTLGDVTTFRSRRCV
jgi:hypothetical protein